MDRESVFKAGEALTAEIRKVTASITSFMVVTREGTTVGLYRRHEMNKLKALSRFGSNMVAEMLCFDAEYIGGSDRGSVPGIVMLMSLNLI